MNELQIDINARKNAVLQWTTNPCGSAGTGAEGTLDYFLDVEQNRYRLQSWMFRYFQFEKTTGKKVLEIGVGHGTDLVQFAKAGAQCHGVDITDRHLNLTAQNFSCRGFHVDLKKCDATKIDYPDAGFDVIYSFGVIHHIPEAELVISEVFRLLKPGGKFYLSLYNKYSSFHFYCILHGLLTGKLFKLGYRGILATVETGADGIHIKPYIKLYTKRKIKKMLKKFTISDFRAFGLSPQIINRLPLVKLFNLEKYLGWFLTCTAIKK